MYNKKVKGLRKLIFLKKKKNIYFLTGSIDQSFPVEDTRYQNIKYPTSDWKMIRTEGS